MAAFLFLDATTMQGCLCRGPEVMVHTPAAANNCAVFAVQRPQAMDFFVDFDTSAAQSNRRTKCMFTGLFRLPQGWGDGDDGRGCQDQERHGGLEDRARADGGRHLRRQSRQPARHEGAGHVPAPVFQLRRGECNYLLGEALKLRLSLVDCPAEKKRENCACARTSYR